MTFPEKDEEGESGTDHYSSADVARNYERTWDKNVLNSKASERFSKFTGYTKAHGHVLDAGCGTGRFCQYFINRGYTVTGIDSSEEMLKIAAKKNPQCTFLKMDVRHLDFPDQTFDGIWNIAVLPHINHKDLSRVLSESRRIMKKDAVIFLATRIGEMVLIRDEESTEGGKFTVNYYTSLTLFKELGRAGFAITDYSIEPDDSGRPFNYGYIYAKAL